MILHAKGEVRGRWRILLNGQNVTDECFYADDLTGVVMVYLRNARGRFYRKDGVPAQEMRRGIVRIERAAA